MIAEQIFDKWIAQRFRRLTTSQVLLKKDMGATPRFDTISGPHLVTHFYIRGAVGVIRL